MCRVRTSRASHAPSLLRGAKSSDASLDATRRLQNVASVSKLLQPILVRCIDTYKDVHKQSLRFPPVQPNKSTNESGREHLGPHNHRPSVRPRPQPCPSNKKRGLPRLDYALQQKKPHHAETSSIHYSLLSQIFCCMFPITLPMNDHM